MHPILGNIRRLSLYLLAWIPLAILTAYLLTIPRELGLLESAALAFPLCLLYAFVCLSAWYPCRVTPIDRSGLDRLLWIHLSAAAMAALLWVLATWVVAWILSANFLQFRTLNARLDPELPLVFGLGILFYMLSVAFFYVFIAVEASKEAEARVMQASVLAREAELRALKAQVNPHFLFNSLNSISALTTSDAPKAREMCILLGDFLRRTLGLGEKASIPLEEEMSLIHAFLAVEKIRYGARLQMEEKIDPGTLNAQVPPLLLQPLVENAVGHGIANLVEGGWIKLAAERRDGELSIVVENLFDPEAPPRRKSGLGLANVRQRLEARYGNRARFATSVDGPCFRVAISLPVETKERAS
jgi:two-component system, LytTR family, sensor histidine kinase AlgZ